MAPEGGQEGIMKINLSMLIDFLLQKSYHELTVLSELLPRKSDIERKIEIVQFASRTQQQFVRLLALVKWAASAERVDKCQAISTFLDHQSMLYVDTADMLARMSRETLVQARLPTFCLPAAVDVLTTGSYPRLPSCIRDKIVPPDPISSVEKVKTLQRLNQVIQHRLVTSKLPPQLSNLEISGGQVKFQVEHEFEVTLTLMGDEPSIPWRLLSIEFLVQDLESGDGKPLVHSLQVQYIHQLVQSRLCSEENPLVDLYNCLHSFCLSLQLEVLQFQAKQLIVERWGDHVRIEEYAVGKKLVLSYWRLHPRGQQHQKQETHTLTVCADEKQNPVYLSVQHKPSLRSDAALDTQPTARIPAGDICVEKLLMQTIKAQSIVKLKELWTILSEDKSIASKVTLDETTPSLCVQSYAEATPFEVIIITMETRNGQFTVSLGDKGDRSICAEMENSLKADPKQFTAVLRDIRCQLHIRKCMRTLAQLPVVPSTYLPFVNANQNMLTSLGKNRLYIRFKRHPNFCLVVEVLCGEGSDKVTVKYHLLQMKPAFADNFEQAGPPSRRKSKPGGEKKPEMRKSQEIATPSGLREAVSSRRPLFLAADHIVPLDVAVMTDYPGTPVKGLSRTTQEDVCGKRQQIAEEPASNKRLKSMKGVLGNCHQHSSYEPLLGHIMASCDARIPFIPLIHQLSQQGVACQGLESESGVGLALRILSLPTPQGCDPNLVSILQQHLLDCVIRLDEKQEQWSLEMLFSNGPVASICHRNKIGTKRVYFTYSCVCDVQSAGNDCIQRVGTEASVVQGMLDDWCSVCRLYQHVVELQAYLQDNLSLVCYMCRVHSYNYKQLTLQYPPDKPNLVTVEWSVKHSQFVLTFGHMTGNVSNPHNFTSGHLQQEFNRHNNLAFLMKILHCTVNPLTALAKLSSKPMGGVLRRQLMMQNFSIVPRSSTCVLIIYRSSFALEIQFRSKNIVAIRDASFSLVDGLYRKGGNFQYIPNLRLFLQNFVDDVTRAGGVAPRNATAADDQSVPSPSPVSMETEASLINAQFMSPPAPASSQSLTASPSLCRSSSQPPGSSSSVSIATAPSPFSTVNVNSPGSFYAASPASFMQPSPASAHSPASSHGLTAQSPAPTPHQFTTPPSNSVVGMTGASPALMPSPISWPVSPQVGTGGQATKYRPVATQGSVGSNITPPRPLTSRTWARTVPTLLSHAAFSKLCAPIPVVTARRLGGPVMLCPLEKFLGTMYLKRHLTNKVITTDETLQSLKSDSAMEVFKVSAGLQCVIVVEHPYTSLRLQVMPLQENVWSQEEITCLEKFFETRVAFAPYKTANLTTFSRLLGAQLNILKDCIKIMKLELFSDASLKWRVEWCLTMPLGFPAVAPAGTASVVLKTKMLFFIQLTRPSSAGVIGDEQSIIIPVLYDTQHNSVQQADLPRSLLTATRGTSPSAINPTTVVSNFLKTWNERAPRTGECSIYPAVLELARNLVIPS